MTQPTKADLTAENKALRELLTVIGGALPEQPAEFSDRNRDLFHYTCRERLAVVAILSRCAMEYAGDHAFVNVLRNSAKTLAGDLAKPLRYPVEAASGDGGVEFGPFDAEHAQAAS